MESNEQEKSNLLNDNPIAAQAGGSFLSKHMGGRVSPLQSKGSMAYQKEDEGSPAELTKEGQKKILSSETANPAFKAAIAKETPVAMNQAPTMKKGSMAYKQGYNAKLDESLGTKNGKKSQSLKDRRDESKGMEKSKDKGAYSSDSQMS